MWALTESQEILRASVQRLLENEYSFEQRRESLGAATGYALPVWERFAELGLTGLPFAEAWGGFGGTDIDVAIVMRELGAGLVVAPYLPTVVLAGRLIERAGLPEVRDSILPEVAAGGCQLAFAFAEPQSRFDLEDVTTRVTRTSTGYVLNGRKSVVINAPQADYLVVTARSSGEQRELDGLSLILVPRESQGVHITAFRTNDDHWAGDITFDDVTLDGDALLGREGQAWEDIDYAADAAAVAVCAESLGAMDRVMTLCQEYLNTREQFGRPIGKNQALQFRMVELFYQIEESRSMLDWALRSLSGGAAARRAAVSATKVKFGNAGRFVGQQGIQLHGAIGMTEEFPVGHYFKRLETLRLLLGDPDYHLARFGRWNRAQNEPAA